MARRPRGSPATTGCVAGPVPPRARHHTPRNGSSIAGTPRLRPNPEHERARGLKRRPRPRRVSDPYRWNTYDVISEHSSTISNLGFTQAIIFASNQRVRFTDNVRRMIVELSADDPHVVGA